MKKVLARVWKEEDGVLSFEWILLLTLLTIGIVSGVAAARDAIIDEFGDWDLFQETLRVLKDIADRHDSSIATVASAYVLQRPQVAAVIVGAHDKSHLKQNEEIGSIVFTEEEFRLIEDLQRRANGPTGEVYGLERNDPRHAGIMHKANNTKS